MKKLIILLVLILSATSYSTAQIAQNGSYRIEQSVVATGGNTSTQPTGSTSLFTLTGTSGQSAAGTTLNNSPFTIKSGFFTPEPFAPTAATVAISGRVLTPNGSGLKNARVIITDSMGNSGSVLTGGFGYFRFEEVEVGVTYVFSVNSKRFQFTPQTVTVTEELSELNFTAQP